VFKRLKDYLKNKLERPFMSYGILPACRRCVYAKSHESILIISKERGPRIIMTPKGQYVRKEKCVGYSVCGLCFEPEDYLPCKWIKF